MVAVADTNRFFYVHTHLTGRGLENIGVRFRVADFVGKGEALKKNPLSHGCPSSGAGIAPA